MSDSQGGPGRREVAFRLFAAEYDDADYSYSESDEERAPNYVITPTGARVNRLFVVGVLTEVENVSEDYLRARVVDPTGPFVVYAGQYQPEAMNFLERAEPPLFVAVTGKARTFQPEDSDRVYTSIRPESISEVDAATRDRWVVQAAEQTIDRVARAAEAKASGLEGERLTAALEAHGVEEGQAEGIALALDHYGTTGEYLAAVEELATDAARVVAGERDEVAGLSLAPGDGSDDPLADLVERAVDVDVVEPDEEGVDFSDVPDPDDEPSPTDAEIDQAVESADVDSADDETDAATETAQEEESSTDDSTAAGGKTAETEASTDESETETADATSPDEISSDSGDEDDVAAGDDDVVTGSDDGAATEDETPTDEDVATDEPAGTDDELEEFDGEFELDEDERAEIEEEFGTEFQSGSEVEEPGAADIETPTEPPAEPGEADVLDEMADEEESDDASEDGSTGADEEDLDEEFEEDAEADDADEGAEDDEAVETAGDVALDDAVMDAMADLDDGDGADRDAVIAEVVQATGADPGEVEEAIQEALMDGRCYEPDDETLKAI